MEHHYATGFFAYGWMVCSTYAPPTPTGPDFIAGFASVLVADYSVIAEEWSVC